MSISKSSIFGSRLWIEFTSARLLSNFVSRSRICWLFFTNRQSISYVIFDNFVENWIFCRKHSRKPALYFSKSATFFSRISIFLSYSRILISIFLIWKRFTDGKENMRIWYVNTCGTPEQLSDWPQLEFWLTRWLFGLEIIFFLHCNIFYSTFLYSISKIGGPYHMVNMMCRIPNEWTIFLWVTFSGIENSL